METILAFVGRTASHLHHCRHHSFFLNLQHRFVLWCRGNIAQKHTWAKGTCWDGDEARRRCPKWNGLPMLCSRLQRSTNAQPGRGRERTAFASRVSTCKQNGLAHERLRYPKPSFCGRFGLPKLRNIVRRSVSYHRRRRSTATIKLTSCHVALAGGRRRWPLASPCARSTRSVQSSAKGTRRLVPLLSALMAERVTNLCKASFGEWYSLQYENMTSQVELKRTF